MGNLWVTATFTGRIAPAKVPYERARVGKRKFFGSKESSLSPALHC